MSTERVMRRPAMHASAVDAPGPRCGARRERGISVVETMIGLLIGMIATVVLFQVLSIAEGQRRTTTSGVDAQVTGSVGLFMLERDLMHAGFGIARMPATYYGCTLAAAAEPFVLRPVRVLSTPGEPDAIDILVGSSPTLSDPVAVGASTSATKQLSSAAGFFSRDRVLLVKASGADRCAMVTLRSDATAVDLPARTIRHEDSAFVAGADSAAVNLGPRPRVVRWFVTNGELRVRDMLDPRDTRGKVVASNVIDLRAQYGIDNPTGAGVSDGRISADEWTFNAPATPDAWSRLLGMRVAVLMRAGQLEKANPDGTPVTASAPTWPSAGVAFRMPSSASDSTSLGAARGAGMTVAPADDWRNYRYRVYESSLVLRNAVWGR